MATFEASWERALQGDFAPLVSAWPDASPAGRAAIDALLSLVSTREPPSINKALSLGAPQALRLLQLRAVLLGEAETLAELAEAQKAAGYTNESLLSARWQGFLTNTATVSPQVELRPAERVEHTVLAALEALARGEEEAAVKSARRAVRMARSDGLVMHELLTSLVLARCRRLEGRPHLATRILATVDAVAPPLWRGWLRYEQTFAGGAIVEDKRAETFAPYRHLRGLLMAAAEGDVNALAESAGSFPGWASSELGILAESLDPERPQIASPDRWLQGTGASCPRAILGFCVPEVGEEGERAPVLLFVRPGAAARRVLALSNKLLGVALPDAFSLAQARTHTAIAHVVSEPGLSRDALFERVYGFAYQSERHSGTLRVLLHRARKILPEGISMVEGGVHVEGPALLPDPRIQFESDTLVLRHLARNAGRASAAQIADALGVSSRKVQGILRALVDDGTCTSIREGRKVEYSLEDTTLSEPTLSRLHPRGLSQVTEI